MLLAAVCKGEVKLYSYEAVESNSNGTVNLVRSIEGGITNADGFMWNPSGTLCGVITKSGGLAVYDVLKNFAVSFEAGCSLKGIKAFYFSPLSTYLVMTERFESKTPNLPNMSLWHVAGKTRIVEGKSRKIGGNAWPSMKWTDDELCCCRVLSPEDSPNPAVREPHILQVLNSRTSKTENFDIPGVCLVEICTGGGEKNSTLAAIFVSAGEDRRARVAVYDLAASRKEAITEFEFDHTVDNCVFRWNKSGDTLLVQAGTEVDESGSSYYGTSKLYLLRLDNLSGGSCMPIRHEPPVHDAQWNGDGSMFCLISGPTPFRMQLLDKRGEEVHDLGRSRKNTVRFSSGAGRFLALGGFGNLAGELDFLDVQSRRTMRATRAECTVEIDWAPNGRIFMTASTHPRMRVDNGITLFSYCGEKVGKLAIPELYAAKWRPMPKAEFPDRPASPRAFACSADVEVGAKKAAAYKAPSNGTGGSGLVVRRAASASPPHAPAVPPQVAPQVVASIVAPTAPTMIPKPTPPNPWAKTPPPPSPQMPCPENDWFYTDPTKAVHGPYTRAVMVGWHKAGYFRADLPIRAGGVLPFTPLNALFPDGIAPFESTMVVPRAWLTYKQ